MEMFMFFSAAWFILGIILLPYVEFSKINYKQELFLLTLICGPIGFILSILNIIFNYLGD